MNQNLQQKIGILLVNLGTPSAPTTAAVRRYLAEFLWDPRVVEIPRFLWWGILHGLILPFRAPQSAKNYQKIWAIEGAPLLINSRKIAHRLEQSLRESLDTTIKVVLAMRYGTPSIAQGLAQLKAANIQRVLILPLYPQYSAATTASTIDAIANELRKWRHLPELRMIKHYADDTGYINALVTQIKNHWQQHGRSAHLLFSFHGLPKRCIKAGDPYQDLCNTTANLVAEQLNLPKNAWTIVFQSRFGREEWLQPYCDQTLQEMPKQGKRKVDIICPGFAADCLETLEEIAETNAHLFKQAGGERLNYIPALNDSPAHIQALSDLALKHLQGWLSR